MLYLIDISWTRVTPAEGMPPTGTDTYIARGKSLKAATRKAMVKFNRKFGEHKTITGTAEHKDPARLYEAH